MTIGESYTALGFLIHNIPPRVSLISSPSPPYFPLRFVEHFKVPPPPTAAEIRAMEVTRDQAVALAMQEEALRGETTLHPPGHWRCPDEGGCTIFNMDELMYCQACHRVRPDLLRVPI